MILGENFFPFCFFWSCRSKEWYCHLHPPLWEFWMLCKPWESILIGLPMKLHHATELTNTVRPQEDESSNAQQPIFWQRPNPIGSASSSSLWLFCFAEAFLPFHNDKMCIHFIKMWYIQMIATRVLGPPLDCMMMCEDIWVTLYMMHFSSTRHFFPWLIKAIIGRDS